MEYEDFVIQVGRDHDEGYTVRVIESPAGQGRSLLTLPASIQQQHQIFRARTRRIEQAREGGTFATSRELDEEERSSAEEALRVAPDTIGSHLFRALFSDPVRSLFDQSLGMLRTTNKGLRIKLKFDLGRPEIAQLMNLPWEYLHRPETKDYLSLSRTTPFVRYLDVPRPSISPPLPEVLRILLVVSSPLGHQQLDLMQEWRTIEAVFQNQPSIEVVLLSQANPEALRKELLDRPVHVLHFMGHGGFEEQAGEGVLYFEGPRRVAKSISGHTLATELRDCRDLRLVLLNACSTARASDERGLNPFAGVATALVMGGLPAVVAMQYPISDPSAIAFSQAFYQRLAMGDPADAAVAEGRLAIRRATPRSAEWGTPVLFMRSPDGYLFAPLGRMRPSEIRPGSLHDPGADLPSSHEAAKPSRTIVLSALRHLRIQAKKILIPLIATGLGWVFWYVLSSEDLPFIETQNRSQTLQITSEDAEQDSPDAVNGTPIKESKDEVQPEDEVANTSAQVPHDGNTNRAPGSPGNPSIMGAPSSPQEVNIQYEASRPQTIVDDDNTSNQNSTPLTLQAVRETPPPSSAKTPLGNRTRETVDRVSGMRFRFIHAGSFRIGSPHAGLTKDSSEHPHIATVTYDFWIGETEVTRRQWVEVTGDSPAGFTYLSEDQPVESINWYEAIQFANRMSRQSNMPHCYILSGCGPHPLGEEPICDEVTFEGLDCRGYRLPTEAEWEVAARTDTGSRSASMHSEARLDFGCPNPGTSCGEYVSHPVDVRCYALIPGDLYGMHGNVSEWTWDHYAPYPQTSATDPTGPHEGQKRVIRGGYYGSRGELCRSAARDAALPEKRQRNIGFRLVRTAQ